MANSIADAPVRATKAPAPEKALPAPAPTCRQLNECDRLAVEAATILQTVVMNVTFDENDEPRQWVANPHFDQAERLLSLLIDPGSREPDSSDPRLRTVHDVEPIAGRIYSASDTFSGAS